MAKHRAFGRYLLQQQLSRDALGETYRAQLTGLGGVERIVLLRLFDAATLGPATLPAPLPNRAERSPYLRPVVDQGIQGGLAYAAWEYSTGLQLDELLSGCDEAKTPLLVEHALLIAERICLALRAGRALHGAHGLLVPPLVRVSVRGEVHVLGFECARWLRSTMAARGLPAAVRPYMDPHTDLSARPELDEDLYSVARLLLDMIGPRSCPAAVEELLAENGGRGASVDVWLRVLGTELYGDGAGPTRFDLAFFVSPLLANRQLPAPAADPVAGQLEAELPAAVAAPDGGRQHRYRWPPPSRMVAAAVVALAIVTGAWLLRPFSTATPGATQPAVYESEPRAAAAPPADPETSADTPLERETPFTEAQPAEVPGAAAPLFEAGPGVEPPRLLLANEAHYPEAALPLALTARVELRLLIDENGQVGQVRIASEPIGYGFEEEAMQVARTSLWHPANRDGLRGRMWAPMTVEFEP